MRQLFRAGLRSYEALSTKNWGSPQLLIYTFKKFQLIDLRAPKFKKDIGKFLKLENLLNLGAQAYSILTY